MQPIFEPTISTFSIHIKCDTQHFKVKICHVLIYRLFITEIKYYIESRFKYSTLNLQIRTGATVTYFLFVKIIFPQGWSHVFLCVTLRIYEEPSARLSICVFPSGHFTASWIRQKWIRMSVLIARRPLCNVEQCLRQQVVRFMLLDKGVRLPQTTHQISFSYKM